MNYNYQILLRYLCRKQKHLLPFRPPLLLLLLFPTITLICILYLILRHCFQCFLFFLQHNDCFKLLLFLSDLVHLQTQTCWMDDVDGDFRRSIGLKIRRESRLATRDDLGETKTCERTAKQIA